MNGSSLKVDDRLIDQLVTGQLTGDRYRQTLEALDADPSKWRDCALAFLAEQALEIELTALSKAENRNWAAAEATNTDMQRTTPLASSLKAAFAETRDDKASGVQDPAASTQLIAHSVKPDRSAKRLRDATWLSPHAISTAALLMVSFLIGWMGSELSTTPTPTRNTREGNPSPVANLAKSPRIENSAQIANRNQTTSSPPSVQYILDQKDQFMPLDRTIPPQLVELERQGKIRLDSVDGIVPVSREDGSVEVVPVQMFRVVPVMRAY